MDGHRESRPECINFLMSKGCRVIVAHDTEHRNYGWGRVKDVGYRRIDYKERTPWATVWVKETTRNVLLVGNGPSAAAGSFGEQIDQFDGLVVRFNKCVLCSAVGFRTDVWATWGEGVDWRELGQSKTLLTTCHRRHAVADKFAAKFSDREGYMRVSVETNQRVQKFIGHPSAGALAAAFFAEDPSVGTVYIYGFDHFSSRAHHYWSPSDGERHGHDPRQESRWFNHLINQGHVRRWIPPGASRRIVGEHNTSPDDSYIVVSGYTEGTAYEDSAAELGASMDKLGVPYKMYPFTSTGNWELNTMMKAKSIKRALEEYQDRDVVWLDADAVVVQDPVFFRELRDREFDVCCHRYRRNELLSGTIVFRHSEATMALVKDWADVDTPGWDQRHLQALMQGKHSNVVEIPLPYDYIRMNGVGGRSRTPCGVIWHGQLSRGEKDKINSGVSRSREAVFQHFYESRKWGGNVSGAGSTKEATRRLVEVFPSVVKELGVTSILDAACGNLEWFPEMDLGDVEYVGVDIVRNLIDSNLSNFPDRRFEFLDITRDDLPECDMVFARDVLVHLPYSDICRFLASVKRSGAKYLAATSFVGRDRNSDVRVGGWRTLNMEVAPFHLGNPITTINERYQGHGGKFADKSISIWNAQEIPF